LAGEKRTVVIHFAGQAVGDNFPLTEVAFVTQLGGTCVVVVAIGIFRTGLIALFWIERIDTFRCHRVTGVVCTVETIITGLGRDRTDVEDTGKACTWVAIITVGVGVAIGTTHTI
tara:strand:- start:46 stop:390 length:345 start_codon:yes stop_codon:yes gene_type:complete